MNLIVISHTPHFKSANGKVTGWGPTLRELDYLSTLFNKVTHLAPLHSGIPPASSVCYSSNRIHYLPLIEAGGKGLLDKLKVLAVSYKNLIRIYRASRGASFIHLRLPCNLGVYVLPFLLLLYSKKKWIKYAGNWDEDKLPWSYRFQRWFIRRNFLKAVVTINGQWPGQESHLLSFENACLTNNELADGLEVAKKKNFDKKLVLLFAGNILYSKGVGLLVNALKRLAPDAVKRIDKVIFVGDGKDKMALENEARGLLVPYEFAGYKTREELNHYYIRSHIFILPSFSEGFPKVIAEASAFGCVPIVTRVSCLEQYIEHGKSGILIKPGSVEEIILALENITSSQYDLNNMAREATKIASLFTYDRYLNRVKKEVFNLEQ